MKRSETWILPLPCSPLILRLPCSCSKSSSSSGWYFLCLWQSPDCHCTILQFPSWRAGGRISLWALKRTLECPLLQLLLLPLQNLFPHLLENIVSYRQNGYSLFKKKKKKAVIFKPMVMCESSGQKMYWLLTLVLAAKLVIDGTCYFRVVFSSHFRSLRTIPIDFPCDINSLLTQVCSKWLVYYLTLKKPLWRRHGLRPPQRNSAVLRSIFLLCVPSTTEVRLPQKATSLTI